MSTHIQFGQTRNKNIDFIYLLFACLISILFFYPLNIIDFQTSGIPIFLRAFVLMFGVLAFFRSLKLHKTYYYSFPIKLIFLSVSLSILSLYVFRNQTILDSIKGCVSTVGFYIVYYYLHQNNIRTSLVEKLILIMGSLFMIVFLTSFLIYPVKIFDYQDFTDDRGFHRLDIKGIGFLFLTFFMSISKIKNGGMWIFFSIISYLCILLSLERLYIVTSTFLGLFLIFRHQKVPGKVIVAVVLVVISLLVFQLEIAQKVSQKLVEKSKDDTGQIEDYIRYKEFDYFLSNQFQVEPWTYITGNGFPYGKSTYGLNQISLNTVEGLYIEDLGFIGLYVYLGVLAILAYVIIFYKTFKAKLPDNLIYLKYFMAFLLLNGLTSSTTYSEYFLAAIVLCLYIISAEANKQVVHLVTVDDSEVIS